MRRRRRYRKKSPVASILSLSILLYWFYKYGYIRNFINSPTGTTILFIIGVFILLPLLGPLSRYIHRCFRRYRYRRVGFDQIHLMTGTEFEYYLDALFSAMGYTSKHVGKSNDYGADIILTDKKGNTICLQAKRYTGKVGIKAVQEIISAKEYYGCTHAIVVTNSYFTSQAINMAQKCNVELWNHDILYKKHCSLHMKEMFHK